MTILRLIYEELVGMFIDDGNLALFSLLLIAVVAALVEFLGLPALWGAAALLIGCIVILTDSVRRAARR